MADEPLKLWEPSVDRRDGVCMKTQNGGRWVLTSDYVDLLNQLNRLELKMREIRDFIPRREASTVERAVIEAYTTFARETLDEIKR